MTSEILIMTPSAIALAADSTVTIGGLKTYQGVNKLFMLSNNPPMGIMIYNTADFFGIPLETIINDFSKSMKSDNNITIEKISLKFKNHLKKTIKEQKIQRSVSSKKQLKLFVNNLKQYIKENGKEQFLKTIISTDFDDNVENFLKENNDLFSIEESGFKDYENIFNELLDLVNKKK
ncbi:hypothetical protein [Methanobrevibacter sp. DSM 116169]|uniref:hypothetical protein n=1 Tax=Methanobrevibacter sp. DSM 116169 TaxID=3242727 RepID=UPI0038FCD41E